MDIQSIIYAILALSKGESAGMRRVMDKAMIEKQIVLQNELPGAVPLEERGAIAPLGGVVEIIKKPIVLIGSVVVAILLAVILLIKR